MSDTSRRFNSGVRTDGTGTQSYTYDDRDAVTSVTTTYTGLPAKTVGYAFYPDGSRAGLSTPAGNFAYSYDAAGRLTSLTNPYSETSSWAYYANNWLNTQTLGNGATTTYTLNPAGQLTDLVNRNSSGTLLSEFSSIGYDGAGNRLSITANLSGVPSYSGLTTYQYDSKDQLTQEQSARLGGYTHGFGYDPAGNPTSFKGVAKSYNAGNQDTANTYDGDGNPTVYQGVGLSFDPENRLTAVGTALTAGYNRGWAPCLEADGRRADLLPL